MYKLFFLLLLLILCLTACSKGSKKATIHAKPDWIHHVDSLLMPFWMSPQALGTPPGNFPAYRYPDGRPIDPAHIDYSILNKEYTQYYMTAVDSLRRDFLRVKSRQIYGYCMAYHLTGNEKYLLNAKMGLEHLLKRGAYQQNSVVTFWRDGLAGPDLLQRNAQDLAYALLAPGAWYYLTRDPQMLDIISRINRFFWQKYYEESTLKEKSKLVQFIKQDFESDSTHFKELLAPLDQLNAYVLLLSGIAPDSLAQILKEQARILAWSIKDNFYSESYNIFWGRLNKKAFDGHSDFAHSIKSFWMIYMTGQRIADSELQTFARQGAEKLLATAFNHEDSCWSAAYMDSSLQLKRNTMTWEHAELDQMAATLSFADSSFYSRYLKQSYPWFERWMIDYDNGGAYWGRNADGTILELGFRSGWHQANFHVLEHALIGYLSTANFYGDDIELYYAFEKDWEFNADKVQPYHYRADIKDKESSTFNDPNLSRLLKSKITFANIR